MRDDGLSLIPITSSKEYTNVHEYYMYSHPHSSVPFYQTTKYKAKMQLLECL